MTFDVTFTDHRDFFNFVNEAHALVRENQLVLINESPL